MVKFPQPLPTTAQDITATRGHFPLSSPWAFIRVKETTDNWGRDEAQGLPDLGITRLDPQQATLQRLLGDKVVHSPNLPKQAEGSNTTLECGKTQVQPSVTMFPPVIGSVQAVASMLPLLHQLQSRPPTRMSLTPSPVQGTRAHIFRTTLGSQAPTTLPRT